METVRVIEEKGSVDAYLASLDHEEWTRLKKTMEVLKNEAPYCHS